MAAAGSSSTGGKSNAGGAAGTVIAGGKSNVAGSAQGPASDDPTKDPFVRSPDSGVLITSSDGLNGSDILLAADSQDGMFIAGATRNAKAMGLTAFDAGITSEAFVARLDSQGKLVWSVALKKCGVPADLAAGPADSVYLACTNEPDTTTLMPSTCNSTALVYKVDGSNGQILFEAQVKNPSSTEGTLCPYGIGVDSTGRSYVGGLTADSGFQNQRAFAIGVTAAGQQDWAFVANGAESTTVDNAVAYTNDVDVDKDGNVLLAGAFNTWVEFGTTRLTSDAKSDRYSMYNGFVARLSSSAANATGWKFGGKVFDYAKSIKPTSDGGFVVGGSVSTSATIGGRTILASSEGSAFVAGYASDGQASWAMALPYKSFVLNLVQAADERVHFVGSFLQGELFYTYDPKLNQLTSRKLVAGDSTTNDLRTTGIAVSTSGTIWLSGTFTGTIDLGTGPLSTSSVAAFLWRMR